MHTLRQTLLQQLPFTLVETDMPFLNDKYAGKVRDNYRYKEHRILITTDKLSAFDRNITTIPCKGEILNAISKHSFEKSSHIIKNHLIDTPDPNVVIAEQCKPIKVEMVIRGFITGSTSTSLWKQYQSGARTIYGLDFPDGLQKNDQLPKPIITPTTKAEHGEHDEPITAEEVVTRNLLTAKQYQELSEITQALYQEAFTRAKQQKLILMDTKYEFGLNSQNQFVLIDELHTPDSSRYALAETFDLNKSQGKEPDNLNKEHLRLWLASQNYTGEGELPEIPDLVRVETAEKYLQCYELLLNTQFQTQAGPITERISNNLKRYYNL